jgi:hypothetical protein
MVQTFQIFVQFYKTASPDVLSFHLLFSLFIVVLTNTCLLVITLNLLFESINDFRGILFGILILETLDNLVALHWVSY